MSASPPGSSLAVIPPILTVSLESDQAPITITLQHMAENTQPIFYKVRRAEPKVVSLRPTRGVLEPGQSISLQVTLKNLRNVRVGDSAKIAFKSIALPVGKGGLVEKDLDKLWEASDPEEFLIKVLKVSFIAKEEREVLSSPSSFEGSFGDVENEDRQVRHHVTSVSFGPTVIFNENATVETVHIRPMDGAPWGREPSHSKEDADSLDPEKIIGDDTSGEQDTKRESDNKKGELTNELDLLGSWATGHDDTSKRSVLNTPEKEPCKKKEKRLWFGSSLKKRREKKEITDGDEEGEIDEEDEEEECDVEESEEDENIDEEDEKNKYFVETDETSHTPSQSVGKPTREKKSWFSSSKEKEKKPEGGQTQIDTNENKAETESVADSSTKSPSPKSKWGLIKKDVAKEKKTWFGSAKKKNKEEAVGGEEKDEGKKFEAGTHEKGYQNFDGGRYGEGSVISLSDASTTGPVMKEKKGWFGRKKKKKQSSDQTIGGTISVSMDDQRDETRGDQSSTAESAVQKEKKRWFGQEKNTNQPDDDDASQVSQNSKFSQGSALSDTSSHLSLSSSGSRWGRLKKSTWALGKKKKKATDEDSVVSVNSVASASSSRPNIEESAIVKLTKDIASTPVKIEKTGKRGWFSSGKKVAKRAKGESVQEEITEENQEPPVPTAPEAVKMPKKSWFGLSSKAKKKEGKDEKSVRERGDDKSVTMLQSLVSNESEQGYGRRKTVSFSELLSNDNSTEASLSPPKPRVPPILNVTNLPDKTWRLSITNCDFMTQEEIEKYVMQVVDSSESGLETSALSELTLSTGEIPDIHFLGGHEDDILMWPNLSCLEVTNVELEVCGSTFSHLQNLHYIDLSNNRLMEIPKFETPFLTTLNLSYNYISEVSRVDHLALEVLDLSHNSFSSLSGLREIVSLKHCLCELKFEGNPLTVPYRNHVLSLLPLLRYLDGKTMAKGGYGTPNRETEHYNDIPTTTTDFDATKYSKHGRNNIRLLRKFMADDQKGELARFLRDITVAKAKAKDRLQDERIRKEAEEAFYKLQRENNNTNAALSEPPLLPAEQDRAWARTPQKFSPRDKSPPRYLEVTASRARHIEVVSAKKGTSRAGHGILNSNEGGSLLPYYATPKGERMFDDDERQRRSEKKQLWKGSATKPKARKTYQASRPYITAMDVEKSLLEENLRNVLNAEGPSREDEMLEGVMLVMGGATEAGDESYLSKLSKPKTRTDKRDDAIAKKFKYEKRKSELLMSIKPIQKETLVKPKRIWKRIDGQIVEVKGGDNRINSDADKKSTVSSLREKMLELDKETLTPKFLSRKQQESVSRLYKAIPKHWETSKPRVYKDILDEEIDVSTIQNVIDTSAVMVKTPIVPRGFEKKIEMLKRGRELEAERGAMRKKSMMLYDAGKDHDMFNKLYNTMSTVNPVEDEDPMKGALDDAIDRLIEVQELIENAQLNGDDCFELEEEQVLLEEFVLEARVQGKGNGNHAAVASLLLSPDVERTVTLDTVAADTPK